LRLDRIAGGAFFWYAIGRWIGEERLKRIADRYGRWLTLTRDDVAKADDWFDQHGHKAVLIGRVLPTVRTLISVPAGISEMRVTASSSFRHRNGNLDDGAGTPGYWLGVSTNRSAHGSIRSLSSSSGSFC
jgi:hypothetical protein